MGYAGYIGRIGALAVSLGIGAVVAGISGVAAAAPESGSDPSNPTETSESPSSDPGGSSGELSEENPDDAGEDGALGGRAGRDEGVGEKEVDDAAGGMKVRSSGGAISSTTRAGIGVKNNRHREADPPRRRSTVKTNVASLAAPTPQTPTHTTTEKKRVPDAGSAPESHVPALKIAAADPGYRITQPTGALIDIIPSTPAAPRVQKYLVAKMTAVTKPLAQTGFLTLTPTADGKQQIGRASCRERV